MTQLQQRAFNPGVAPHPLGAYSQAMEVRPGRLPYVAGQVGLDANGNLPGAEDAAAQTRQAVQNLGPRRLTFHEIFENRCLKFATSLGRNGISGR